MRKGISQHEVENVSSELKAQIQNVAVFKSEKLPVSNQDDPNAIKKAEKEYGKKLNELHLKLDRAIKSANKLLKKLKNSLQSGKYDKRRIKSASLKNKQSAGKKGLSEALRQQELDNKKIEKWKNDLKILLNSAQNVRNRQGPGIRVPGKHGKTVFKTDKEGNPFSKLTDEDGSEHTIHFDKNHNVTASHVKDKEGNYDYVNNSDIFLTETFSNQSSGDQDLPYSVLPDNKYRGSYNPDIIEEEEEEAAGFDDKSFFQRDSLEEILNDELNHAQKLREFEHHNYDLGTSYSSKNESDYTPHQQDQVLFNNYHEKIGSISNDHKLKDKAGNILGSVDFTNQSGPKLRDLNGDINDILADGTLINKYGARAGRIGNFRPPTLNYEANLNSRVSGHLNKTFQNIYSNQFGPGNYDYRH